MSSTASAVDDHAYFQAIEERFIRLRGAPLLLSPSDWQLAKTWQGQGIPLELVLETLDEVFAARRARGAKGKVQGLRYCAPAVEKAWSDRQDLLATGMRSGAEPIELRQRLTDLAASLSRVPGLSSDFSTRVASLGGSAANVEVELSRLDREMIETLAASLDTAVLDEIRQVTERSLDKLESRMDKTEVSRVRERLVREGVRRHLGLPVLSLFSVPSSQA